MTDSQNPDFSKSQNSNEVDSKDILDSFRRSQVMQAYAICQGITAKSSSSIRNNSMATFSQNARLASYQFHPVSEKSGKVDDFMIAYLLLNNTTLKDNRTIIILI